MKNLSFYYFNKTKQTQSSLKKYFSFQNFFYSQNKNIFFTIVKLKEKSKNFKSEILAFCVLFLDFKAKAKKMPCLMVNFGFSREP